MGVEIREACQTCVILVGLLVLSLTPSCFCDYTVLNVIFT